MGGRGAKLGLKSGKGSGVNFSSGGSYGGITGGGGSGVAGGGGGVAGAGGAGINSQSTSDQPGDGVYGGTGPQIVKIAGFSVEKYTEIYNFTDGTKDGIHVSTEATVYRTEDGTQFVFQNNLDTSKQDITPEKIISAYNLMPEKIQNACPKNIAIVDYENPRDVHWRQQYRNFTKSNAIGDEKEITFFGTGSEHNISGLRLTLSHETGHAIDNRLIDSHGRMFSERDVWSTAMELDRQIHGRLSPTLYGENSHREDFAESIKEFTRNAENFRTSFPNRAAIIESLLDDY